MKVYNWVAHRWRMEHREQIFGLSDQEKTFIERADRGFGILLTEQGRVPFYNKLTDMEYSHFTTNPEEVTAVNT